MPKEAKSKGRLPSEKKTRTPQRMLEDIHEETNQLTKKSSQTLKSSKDQKFMPANLKNKVLFYLLKYCRNYMKEKSTLIIYILSHMAKSIL